MAHFSVILHSAVFCLFSMQILRRVILLLFAGVVGIVLGVTVTRLIVDDFGPENRLEPVDVIYPDGVSHTLRFGSDTPQVVVVFNPMRAFENVNLSAWNEVATLARNKFQVLGVATTAKNLEGFIQGQELKFPVFVVEDREQLMDNGIYETPWTLVIDVGGAVRKEWFGTFTDSSQREQLLRFFVAERSY